MKRYLYAVTLAKAAQHCLSSLKKRKMKFRNVQSTCVDQQKISRQIVLAVCRST